MCIILFILDRFANIYESYQLRQESEVCMNIISRVMMQVGKSLQPLGGHEQCWAKKLDTWQGMRGNCCGWWFSLVSLTSRHRKTTWKAPASALPLHAAASTQSSRCFSRRADMWCFCGSLFLLLIPRIRCVFPYILPIIYAFHCILCVYMCLCIFSGFFGSMSMVCQVVYLEEVSPDWKSDCNTWKNFWQGSALVRSGCQRSYSGQYNKLYIYIDMRTREAIWYMCFLESACLFACSACLLRFVNAFMWFI